MAVYNIRIESTAEWCEIELRSAALWARAPGRLMSVEHRGLGTEPVDAERDAARVDIEDRIVRIRHSPRAIRQTTVVVHLATGEDRVSMHTTKSQDGGIRITSASDQRANLSEGAAQATFDPVLFLDQVAAAAAGARGGDPFLAH